MSGITFQAGDQTFRVGQRVVHHVRGLPDLGGEVVGRSGYSSVTVYFDEPNSHGERLGAVPPYELHPEPVAASAAPAAEVDEPAPLITRVPWPVDVAPRPARRGPRFSQAGLMSFHPLPGRGARPSSRR